MAEMNIRPLADRVLVEAKPAETKTASGIYIPLRRKNHKRELLWLLVMVK